MYQNQTSLEHLLQNELNIEDFAFDKLNIDIYGFAYMNKSAYYTVKYLPILIILSAQQLIV